MKVDNTKETRRQAAKYAVTLIIQRFIGLACFLLAAGTLLNLQGWIYFFLYFMISVVSLAVMLKSHAETLSERGKKHDNTKGWDKILLPIFVLLTFYGIYVIAGIGVRLSWNRLSMEWFYVGIALYLVSCIFNIWPVMENKHFESTSRIQNDRVQSVITTGPYRIVRHPGYTGIVIWSIAIAFMFGTLAVGIASAFIIIIICIRTYLEDTMLKNELTGYTEYTKIVKYRLLPFIW